jgi:subtilase family serine protease
VASALFFCTASLDVSILPAQQFASAARIVDRIEESNLVTLKGNTHPAANAKNDRGQVSPLLPMTDLILVLSRSPQQQAAFDSFVASQYDANSPNFHQWLTPEQVGENFGPSPTDIATISNWLTGHGLTVSEVTKDRMSIRFGGTAAQVQSAFHTEIHNLEVKGTAHIGNMSDPRIPAALTPVVVGVKSLHNFFPRPQYRLGQQVQRDAATGKWKRGASARLAGANGIKSQFTINVPASGNNSAYTVEDVTPYDFATIYNVLPLWNNAGIDGTGQTIAIAGTSSIATSDVATFRTFFDLPTAGSANTPIFKSGNSEPVTICSDSTGTLPYPTNPCGVGDLFENTLDVEWSGAVAKNAQIILVSSYPASESDDTLFDSENYIIQHAIAPIMNVSYGECELGLGTAGNVEYYNLWYTAASGGIAVFVATGDSGAASCDDGGDQIGYPYSAQGGTTVSGLASTPWNTAVGGTDFNWCPLTDAFNGTACPTASYWNSTNNSTTHASAVGYVPEVPWNNTCSNPLALDYIVDWAKYADVSGVNTAETACNFVENDWLSLAISPADYVIAPFIDTTGGGGGASNCVVNTGGDTFSNIYGTPLGTCSTTAGAGTTGAADGSLPTYNNGWPKPSWQTGVTGIPSDGVRDIPDVSFFASNGFLYSAYLICVYDNGAIGNPQCTYSNDVEPTAFEVGGTSVSTPAMAGVMALINQKAGAAQGSPNSELYKLAAKQPYSSCSAESVTAGSASCYFNDIDTGTNAMPCDYGASEGGAVYDPNSESWEPGSTYSGIVSSGCSVLVNGDTVGIQNGYSAATGYDQATGLGSLNVYNVVEAWPAASGLGAVTVTVNPSPTTILISESLVVTGTVASSPTGGAVPTGTVILTAGSYTSDTSTLSGSGTYSITIPANSLIAGTDTINVAYSGNSTYTTGSGQAQVTVEGAGATFNLAAAPSPTSIAPGATSTVTVTATSVAGYAGSMTLTCQETSFSGGTPTDAPSCNAVGGTASITLGSTGSASFAVETTPPSSSELTYPQIHGKGRGWMGAGGGAVLALLVFFGIPSRRRGWRQMLGALVLFMALGSIAACGGGGGGGGTSDPGTSAGTYTFTITATPTPAVSPVVTQTFTVTVN